MKKDIPLPEDMDKSVENVYEAVMIIARRARKIGADQKLEIDKMLNLSETESEEEESLEEEDCIKPEINYEKPSVIAMRELTKGDLEFEYREKSSG